MVQLTEWMRMNVEVKERDAGNIPKTNLSVVQIVRGEHGILIYTKKTTVLQVPQHFIFLILIILWEGSHLIPASFSFSSVKWTQSSLPLKLERKRALSHVRLLWSHELCSLPGSSVHGILQARILEWVAISFSRGTSQPRNWTQVSRIAGRCLTDWAT